MEKNKSCKTPACPVPNDDFSPDAKTINLAIQGGGAHGAYSWGIIDKFLEDGRIRFDGISGASAGSMNAVMLAYGLMQGGRQGARKTLRDFWLKTSEAGALYSPLRQMPWEAVNSCLTDTWNMDNSLTYQMFNIVTGAFSPYQFNPFNVNPLREVVESIIDFEVLKQCQNTQLFIATTKVRTGKVKVFCNNELSIDVVMASACLPMLFQAVTIDGEHYWDGGYMGNPALFPFFKHTKARDILVLHTNPVERDELPTSAADIMNRINEISFNSSLIKEMRAISFVTKLLDEGWVKDEFKHKLKPVLMHSIRADETLIELSVASKYNTNWRFLTYLRDLGRDNAEKWLAEHFKDIDVRATVDLRKEFLDLGFEPL